MASQAASVNEAGSGMSRREFLYYIWGASIAILTLQSVGLLIWFLIPRFREGEFGGRFFVPIDALPGVNEEPANFADGRFWLVNLNTEDPNELMYPAEGDNLPIVGVASIYKVCTHLGCIYSWTPTNSRFECPCHGSKYRLDGRRIESPAPRTLDRFKVLALAEDKSTVLAEASLNNDNFWDPLSLPDGTAFIGVDTGDRKQGPSQILLCDFTNSCP